MILVKMKLDLREFQRSNKAFSLSFNLLFGDAIKQLIRMR